MEGSGAYAIVIADNKYVPQLQPRDTTRAEWIFCSALLSLILMGVFGTIFILRGGRKT
jgi:hypothetical protein